MSQSGKYFEGTVAPDIETLTGNSGGPVGPDGSFNVTFRGKNSSYVLGTPGSNLLEIYGSATYLVDKGGNAPYTTIQSAITQAQTDGASNTNQKYIVIKSASSTYAENLTVTSPGIVLVSWDRYQSEIGQGANSAILYPGVVIQGTLSTNSNIKIIGISFIPPDGSAAISISAFSYCQVIDCKFEMTNAAMWAVSGNPVILCSRVVGIFTGTSATDKLLSTASSSGVVFFADDCHFDLSVACAVTGNYFFANCNLFIFFNFNTSNLSVFTFQNTRAYAGTVNPLIKGGASDVIQITAYNSSLESQFTNLFDFTGATSQIKAHCCQLYGNLSTGTATTIELMECSGWNASTSSWQPTTRAFGNAINQILQQTGTASVQAQRICTTGGDPSTMWGITSTRGYCQGVDYSDTSRLKLTSTNSTSISPSTGSTLWTVYGDASDLATVYTQPLVSPGGPQMSAKVTSTPYTVALSECYIPVQTDVARTILLPNQPRVGTRFYVKDIAGNAAAANITVQSVDGLTNFDAGFSDIIVTNWAERHYTYVSSSLGYAIG